MEPIYVGKTDGDRKLYLEADDLKTHIHGIGASRQGKSKLAEWLIRQLVEQRVGCCVIDPHGQLYEDLVEWLAYYRPKRQKVVLFDLSSQGRIVGFNPFRPMPGADVNVQADRRVQATLKAWGVENPDATPRLGRWLSSLYHALIESNQTLDAARYMVGFDHQEVRKFLADHVTTDIIQDQFATLSRLNRQKDFDEQMESTLNRLIRFIGTPQLRRIMGLTINNLDLEGIIERGDILLVNLQPSGFFTQENRRLIGTLLLNEVWEIVMRRKRGKRQTIKDFFLTIDEFQLFLTPDIGAMLDQSAKFGLHLMLFHQHLAQLQDLDKSAYASLMTNARIKFVFGGLMRKDARTFAEEIFAGQIDFNRLKFVIEQTKFRPVYDRDKVYMRSSGGGTGDTSAHMTGTSFSPGASWNEQGFNAADSSSNLNFSNWNDGEADVPIYRPEEFKEVSSKTAYPLEEQLFELTDKIMRQNQRAYMLALPRKDTVVAIAPFVEKFDVKEHRVAAYVEQQLKEFKTLEEVDQILEASHRNLLKQAKVSHDTEGAWEEPKDLLDNE